MLPTTTLRRLLGRDLADGQEVVPTQFAHRYDVPASVVEQTLAAMGGATPCRRYRIPAPNPRCAPRTFHTYRAA